MSTAADVNWSLAAEIDKLRATIEQQDAALEAKDAEIERLKSGWHDCISDLTAAQKRAEQAERALAEAVKVINRQTNNALAAADLLADGAHRIDVTQDEWREHAAATEAARAFIKEHSKS